MPGFGRHRAPHCEYAAFCAISFFGRSLKGEGKYSAFYVELMAED
jgi:hypothetical protein